MSTISIDGRGTAAIDAERFHPTHALVRFRNGAPRDSLPGSPSAIAFAGYRSLHLVEDPPGLSVAKAVRRYRANPNVLYAEPDYIIYVDATPSDPEWRQQWDMVKISAPLASNTQTDSSSVVVAIIDTGIDFTHPDLQANLWTNLDGSHGLTCIRAGALRVGRMISGMARTSPGRSAP